MRDPFLANKKYFDRFLETKSQILAESKKREAEGQIAADNLNSARHLNFKNKLESVIAIYSRGDSIDKVQTEFDKIFDSIELEWTDDAVKFKKGKPQKIYDQYWLNSYCYMIWLISISILIGINDSRIKQLTSLIEDGNFKDELLLFLLSKLNNKEYSKLDPTTYSPFRGLTKNELHNIDSSTIKKYLNKWYKNTKLLSWHAYLKSAPEKKYYFGYWSFEAAAIAAVLEIDDSTFNQNQYYPQDLVKYYRKKNCG